MTQASDLDYRPTALTTSNILERNYGFDANSNITSLTDNITTSTQTFNYDSLDRLDQADDSDTNYGDIDYQYDATHNRTARNSVFNSLTDNQSYTYPLDSNKLSNKIAGTVTHYQYDANGNMTDNGTYQFAYSDDNRLHTVSHTGQVKATYTYNAQGQRSQKTTSTTTTYYLYGQQGELLAEADTTGQLNKSYLFANGQLLAVAQEGSTAALPVEILLDNDDASFSDNWPSSTDITGYQGTDYQYHAGNLSNNPGVLGTPIDNTAATYTGTWAISSGDSLTAGLPLEVPNTLNVTLTAAADTAALNLATGTLIDTGEFKANTYTHYIQQSTITADLADGGFIVVWESYLHPGDSNANGVYAQRYNAQGIAQGSEFQVNTYITKWQEHPSAAGLNNGDFVITWQSYQQEGSSNGHGIYGQRYTAQGVTIGSEFHINTYIGGDQRESQVTRLNDGGFIVTWHSDNQDGSGRGIYAQRYDAQGVSNGPEFKINSTTTNDQHEPSIASLTNGGFVVTWHSTAQDSDGSTGIYGQRYDAQGLASGNEFQINTHIANAQTNSSVAGLTNGGFIVTWQSAGQDNSLTGVYGQRYDAQGATEGNEFKANTHNTSHKIRPTVAGLTNGEFVIAWDAEDQDSSDNSMGLYGQRYDPQGQAKGSEFHINSYTTDIQRNIYLSRLNSGGFIVGWTSEWQDSNWGGIYAKRYELTPVTGDNYTVQANDTWSSIASNVYSDVNAASALQTDMLNADLTVVTTLNLPLSLEYTTTLTANSTVLSTTTPPYYTVLNGQSWQDIAFAVYSHGSQTVGDTLANQLAYINPYYGTNYQYHPAGTGANTPSWNTNVATSGNYDIYATWVADTDRATDARYIVNHTAGSDTVIVNQQQQGSQWQLLGTYTLDPTSTVILSDNANGIVVADGLTILPAGTALTSPSETATWTPHQTGEYYIYVNWTADTDRASNATYTLSHTSGNDTISVDQQQNGSQWHLLGTYTLDRPAALKAMKILLFLAALSRFMTRRTQALRAASLLKVLMRTQRQVR
ncbi:MAG: hypothetical protein JKY04_03125, partial [Sneathiella sp.]|nr:hypothetical protein [Sneathiella sp.]